MAWQLLQVKITGLAPYLQHSGELSLPGNPTARAIKKISSKRNKTESDHEEMSRLEYLGSMYVHDGAPCIPGVALEAAIAGKGGAAGKEKARQKAAAGFTVPNQVPLSYKGPKDPKKLWAHGGFVLKAHVKVGMARVQRTRPMFSDWSAVVTAQYNDTVVDREEVIRWFHVAGENVGIGDWRPRYGRFTVEEVI